MATRRQVISGLAAGLVLLPSGALRAAEAPDGARVIHDWYRLVLELVRHTPTASPPMASRAFAIIGTIAWEAVRPAGARSLAGQVTGLADLPARPARLDDAAVLHAALSVCVKECFANTGPTGQRAVATMIDRLGSRVNGALTPEVAAASAAHGQAVAGHVGAWAATDGGAVITNMGFPETWRVAEAASDWVPTTLVRLQQTPLLPDWGRNRPFALADGSACGLPPPPDYSEEPGSAFHAEALEVYETVKTLTPEQRLIARFWSDDPMLSPTPPGHWISIAMQVLEGQAAPADRRAEVLALLGITMADAFIVCWRDKYAYDLLRPVTYIRRVIDKTWEPVLITPPFPEYPSGHSVQSAAAAAVLTHLFGEGFAFTDTTHVDEGLPARDYPDFWTAAREAGMSRLYGGIHYRAAIERGQEQGACVAEATLRLQLRA
ncbi:MAG: vanadium-dependent haloperoxidase [Gemmobacter sp.]